MLPTPVTWNTMLLMSFNPSFLKRTRFSPLLSIFAPLAATYFTPAFFGAPPTNVSCCNMFLGRTDSAAPESIVTFPRPSETNAPVRSTSIDDLVRHEHIQPTNVNSTNAVILVVLVFAVLLIWQILEPILEGHTWKSFKISHGWVKPVKGATIARHQW